MQQATMAESIDVVVDSYYRFLARNEFDGHLKRFKDRLLSDKSAAEAEAAMFMMLWNEKLDPSVNENLETGGPDFRCSPAQHQPFLVEVTSLDSESLSEKSTLPLKIEGPGGQAYGLVTQKLRSTVKGKASQLGGQADPSVLAITSSYDFAGLLLDRMAAHNLLISDPWFSVPIGGRRDAITWQTDLKNAVFCIPGLLDAGGNQTFRSCSRSVSAILLVTINSTGMDAVGLLHPDPVRPFDPASFPSIPFIRFQQWPIIRGRVTTEWIQDSGNAHASFRHKRIR